MLLVVVVVLRVALRVASGSLRLCHHATGGGVVVVLVVLVAGADHTLLLQNHNIDVGVALFEGERSPQPHESTTNDGDVGVVFTF